jgi:RNA polymerase sigma-70 factor (ECF subfamily)
MLLPAPLPCSEVDSTWRPALARDQLQQCDRAQFAVLYERHSGAIHRFLRDLLGDDALAADATQETFVRAFHRMGTLDDRANVAPWLFGIARNVSREFRKARTRARRTFLPEPQQVSEPIALASGSPEGELLDREAVRVVGVALATLSEDRRTVLLLRLDHALAYEQIATLMGWSLAKVKVEIFRAREQLRAAMQQYEGGAR